MLQKIYRYVLLIFGFSLIFLGVFLYLTNFSINKANLTTTYFPKAEAELNFYQDSLGNTNYTQSGSSFWSSSEYYNNSYSTAKVRYGDEIPESVQVSNNYSVYTITRDSH